MAERTCITTGQTLSPHRLIRFVAAPDGSAVADLAGRLPGRGAWVTATEEAIRTAEKRGQSNGHLAAACKATIRRSAR